MTKNQNNDRVGDSKSPARGPSDEGLRIGVDQAFRMPAEFAEPLRQASALATLTRLTAVDKRPVGSCLQRLWLSFFFDGTGNNIDADIGSLKHSNIARLYNVHPPNDVIKGNYRIYIPGVGTYFKDIDDAGGDTLGLAMARYGDLRLGWALSKFDELMMPHLKRAASPANRIVEVNVAVFGFSRGAALARAFVNRLVASRAYESSSGWYLAKANAPLRIRLMGLFDTVASVGLGLSSNTTNALLAKAGGAKLTVPNRIYKPKFETTWPVNLAFAPQGYPGADPAPGYADGHQAWGGEIAISPKVEQVRHYVAAHEIRNSFPLDSIWLTKNGRIQPLSHFHETVYPGVHSDVGGGYRPGEGGRSLGETERLSQIPLNHMYEMALDAGVPLLPKTAWSRVNHREFAVDAELQRAFDHYSSRVAKYGTLGENVSENMRVYYSWRFLAIYRKEKGNRFEAEKITAAERDYSKESDEINAEIKRLAEAERSFAREHSRALYSRNAYLQANYGNAKLNLEPYDTAVDDAAERHDNAQDKLLKARARLNALPNTSGLVDAVAMYDRQLLNDARSILSVCRDNFADGRPSPKNRANLRPHYRAIVEAYENVYLHGRGLKDERIVGFFENYVHDSLSGFATDATLPSDPRVIYLGGDEKYRYAHNEQQRKDEEERRYASTAGDGKTAQSA